jgi:hypothetical protein
LREASAVYQITRKNRIKEQLQLCHANGDVACTLDVDINVDRMTAKISDAYDQLGRVQNELMKDQTSEKLIEEYGKAVALVLTAIFGDEGCAKILDFYEDNYTECLIDILPFVSDEIMPKIREASKARKVQLQALLEK